MCATGSVSATIINKYNYVKYSYHMHKAYTVVPNEDSSIEADAKLLHVMQYTALITTL